jgi:hypothetical protein
VSAAAQALILRVRHEHHALIIRPGFSVLMFEHCLLIIRGG